MKRPKCNCLKEVTHFGNIVKNSKKRFIRPFLCMSNLSSMSVQHFERNMKNEFSNAINVFSFLKGEVP